eukprot:1776080-Rhodomonas_salina.1
MDVPRCQFAPEGLADGLQDLAALASVLDGTPDWLAVTPVAELGCPDALHPPHDAPDVPTDPQPSDPR